MVNGPNSPLYPPQPFRWESPPRHEDLQGSNPTKNSENIIDSITKTKEADSNSLPEIMDLKNHREPQDPFRNPPLISADGKRPRVKSNLKIAGKGGGSGRNSQGQNDFRRNKIGRKVENDSRRENIKFVDPEENVNDVNFGPEVRPDGKKPRVKSNLKLKGKKNNKKNFRNKFSQNKFTETTPSPFHFIPTAEPTTTQTPFDPPIPFIQNTTPRNLPAVSSTRIPPIPSTTRTPRIQSTTFRPPFISSTIGGQDFDETPTRRPFVSSTRRPFVSSTRRPFVSSTRRPFVSSTRRPFVSSTRRPFVSTTQAPIVSTTRAPFVSTTRAPEVDKFANLGPPPQPAILQNRPPFLGGSGFAFSTRRPGSRPRVKSNLQQSRNRNNNNNNNNNRRPVNQGGFKSNRFNQNNRFNNDPIKEEIVEEIEDEFNDISGPPSRNNAPEFVDEIDEFEEEPRNTVTLAPEFFATTIRSKPRVKSNLNRGKKKNKKNRVQFTSPSFNELDGNDNNDLDGGCSNPFKCPPKKIAGGRRRPRVKSNIKARQRNFHFKHKLGSRTRKNRVRTNKVPFRRGKASSAAVTPSPLNSFNGGESPAAPAVTTPESNNDLLSFLLTVTTPETVTFQPTPASVTRDFTTAERNFPQNGKARKNFPSFPKKQRTRFPPQERPTPALPVTHVPFQDSQNSFSSPTPRPFQQSSFAPFQSSPRSSPSTTPVDRSFQSTSPAPFSPTSFQNSPITTTSRTFAPTPSPFTNRPRAPASRSRGRNTRPPPFTRTPPPSRRRPKINKSGKFRGSNNLPLIQDELDGVTIPIASISPATATPAITLAPVFSTTKAATTPKSPITLKPEPPNDILDINDIIDIVATEPPRGSRRLVDHRRKPRVKSNIKLAQKNKWNRRNKKLGNKRPGAVLKLKQGGSVREAKSIKSNNKNSRNKFSNPSKSNKQSSFIKTTPTPIIVITTFRSTASPSFAPTASALDLFETTTQAPFKISTTTTTTTTTRPKKQQSFSTKPNNNPPKEVILSDGFKASIKPDGRSPRVKSNLRARFGGQKQGRLSKKVSNSRFGNGRSIDISSSKDNKNNNNDDDTIIINNNDEPVVRPDGQKPRVKSNLRLKQKNNHRRKDGFRHSTRVKDNTKFSNSAIKISSSSVTTEPPPSTTPLTRTSAFLQSFLAKHKNKGKRISTTTSKPESTNPINSSGAEATTTLPLEFNLLPLFNTRAAATVRPTTTAGSVISTTTSKPKKMKKKKKKNSNGSGDDYDYYYYEEFHDHDPTSSIIV